MSGFKFQISPIPKKKPDIFNTDRPSSRTDQLVEASFSSEISPIDYVASQSLNSLRSGMSSNKLREILSRTSEKLSGYTGKNEYSYQELLDKVKEISELKKRIKILEIEKKEIQDEYNKLAEASQALRDPVLDSDVASMKIAKLSNTFISKIKENAKLSKSFFDLVGSENDFFLQIKSENFKYPFISLLQFLNECIDSNWAEGVKINEVKGSFRSYSSMADDDYFKLIEESDKLAKTIANQKAKISEICEKVKENMRDKNSSVLGVGRPYSVVNRSDRLFDRSPEGVRDMIPEEYSDDRH